MDSGTSTKCSARDALCAAAQYFHSCSIVPPHSPGRLSCMHAVQPVESGCRPSTPQEMLMKVLVVVLGLMTLLAAHPALAQRPHGGPGFLGPGPGGPPAGRLLERLIDPCRPACFDTARNCHETAEANAMASVQSPCAAQIQVAQGVCTTSRTSPDCQNAVRALRTCAQPYLTSLRSDFNACRSAAEACVDACESTQ